MKIFRIAPVVLLTTVLLCIIFRNIIPDLNSRYFSAGGDGLKSYYCASYHIKYDTDSHIMRGMNYPWGESIYFTDGQPPLTNTVRFIDHNLFPCGEYIAGIFNFMMIFSILLSAVFLFLIFQKFRMPVWYSTLLATGISLLSPQMGRLSGHFSLSWGFWIPLLIYLMILIIENKSWLTSMIFGIVTLLASLMHMYFFLFSVALAGVCLLEWIFFNYQRKQIVSMTVNLILQLIIPYIFIQLVMLDGCSDRTMHPYGFMVYLGIPGGVFLPLNKWYAMFIMKLPLVYNCEWEAQAYIGVVVSAGFWIMFIRYIINLFRKVENKLSFTGERSLDILFWASLLALIFSFGVPFIFGLEKLRDSIGFLSQLRAVGRFSWLFYYVINIIIWIKIYRYFSDLKNKAFGYALILVFLGMLGFEAYNFTRDTTTNLNNEIPELADRNNLSPENAWINKIDIKKYQAIMPLPYFHIGSENIWIDPRCGIDKQMYIASLKTGLPCNAVMMGRTSISQTFKNVELCKTPWKQYRVLDEYPDKRPLLLMVAKCEELNADEKRLVENAIFLISSPSFDLYEMPVATLKAIPGKYDFPGRYKNITDTIANNLKAGNGCSYLDRSGNFNNIKASGEYQKLLETTVSTDTSKNLYVRFWIKDYVRDLVACTNLLIIQDKPDQEFLEEKYSDIFRHIRTFDGDKALIEIKLKPKQEKEIIKLFFKNAVLEGNGLSFSEISVSQYEL